MRRIGTLFSRVHLAWAEAAVARTSGLIPMEFWLTFDPYGGTAGPGPNVLPEGEWPGVISAIAIGHHTDWSLGRYFGTGPMALLGGPMARRTSWARWA